MQDLNTELRKHADRLYKRATYLRPMAMLTGALPGAFLIHRAKGESNKGIAIFLAGVAIAWYFADLAVCWFQLEAMKGRKLAE
jgi:hypothetical protein